MSEHHLFPHFPMPVLVLPGALESALPLELTRVNVQITGPLASVAVTQRFGNPFHASVELDYLFPMPEDAAITGFEVRIGSRLVLGDLQERDTAQNIYSDAIGQGKRAGLFEQRRPNLYAVRLANIQPGESIEASVRYQQRVRFMEGVYEFIYPMGLTPRYDRPQHPDESEGVHAPVALPGEKIGLVEIGVAVDAGIPAGEPFSPSHPLGIIRTDERRFQVRVSGEQIPDHDFVLRYPLAPTVVSTAGWTSGEPGKEFFLATIVPPRMEEEESQPAPREFTFVLDRSGSMSGQPIAQARNALRACLRSLNPEDTFRILLFDHELEWLQAESLPVTQESIDMADVYLGQVQGRGGTEIIHALESVLGLPDEARRTRFVVFLTDGAVSAEAQALEQIRKHIGVARLFVFGVGPSVNRALLSRMARLGRGRAEFLQLDEDIEGAIIRFQDSVSFPVLTGLALEWENGKVWDLYPARLPDLYEGQPLEICGRLARTTDGLTRAALRGERNGKPVELHFVLQPPATRDQAVERVWAQARVEDLLEQQELEPARAQKIRADILALALEYNLVTVYTSFVAVDEEGVQTNGHPRILHVAQPLPKGVSFEGLLSHTPKAVGMVMSASFMPQAPMPPSPSTPASMLRSMLSAPARKMNKEQIEKSMAGPRPPAGEPLPARPQDRETTLRWLARTQKLDGSWAGNIEHTAAALLAFLRAGNTTRTGSFRQALRRAAGWLTDHPSPDFPGFVRAIALYELARATGNEQDLDLAQKAQAALPAPATFLEKAALGEVVQPPQVIQSLDDLRLAGILQLHLPVSLALFQGPEADLVKTWSAALPQA